MTDQNKHAESRQAAPAMRIFTPSRLMPGTNRLRLQTLVRLRWLAVGGQMLAVVGVYYGLGFPLPLALCVLVIAISVWLNIFLTLRYPAILRLRNRYGALLLAYDIVQLAVLIALTGGLQNPFWLLFLVPTTVSASTLPLKHTLWLEGLALLSVSAVAIFHLPLPWVPGETLTFPAVYIFGVWAALVCGHAFTGIYAWRIAEESRRMSDALAASEQVLAREQQLSALDGLAAAAAHELGTPLATIALVAKELKRELPNSEDFAEDLDLLNSQVGRCREILATLSARGASGDEVLKRFPLSVMIAEIAHAQGNAAKSGMVETDTGPGDGGAEPVIKRNPEILYGIGNLVKNALDFAAGNVALTATWDHDTITIVVSDDGPGFAADILNKLGEPYVTTRTSAPNAPSGEAETKEGMGLGFFIAKTFLERTGASLSLANRPSPQRGAIVRVAWPRAMIEWTQD